MSEKDKNKLTHLDESGAAKMVDVSKKERVRRTARARGRIKLKKETIKLIKEGLLKKGDALAAARIAGIMGARKTSDLIPLCHNVDIDYVDVSCQVLRTGIEVESTAVCVDKTGIEMEALTAVGLALLTIYDMCKAVDKEMEIGKIVLIEKKKEKVKKT